jgi:hypothetical protein
MRKLPPQLTIKRMKRVTIPQKFIFVDTETEREDVDRRMIKNTLKLGHAIYWQREKGGRAEILEDYPFDNAFDFWQWAAGKVHARETVYIFAHNVAFDFLVLDGFRLLPCVEFTLQSLYYRFTTAVLRFAFGNKRMVISDTMNYFQVPLEKLGASVGLPKGEINFEKATLEELRSYCKRDAEIIYTAVRNLVNETASRSLGSFKVTASGLAASAYRHTFMKHEIVTCHIPEVVAFEKDAYTGGVVAVNRLVAPGREGVYKLDFNSMYPSVMVGNNFPVRLVELIEAPTFDLFEMFLRMYLVVGRVRLNASHPYYPLKTPSGTIYPLGDFVTTLTTPLLRHALEHGEIVEVEKIAVYNKKPIFDDYVNFMHSQRLDAKANGDEALNQFYKMMSNSLYGKFAQTRTESKRISDAPPNTFAVYDAIDPVTREYWKELHAGGSVTFIYERGEAEYTSYAIAAHVTDYARLKLFKTMEVAGRDNVFYSDTDSLIVNGAGYAALGPLIDADRLGALKVEDEGRLFVGFSKKDYTLGDTAKRKGFNPHAKRLEGNVFQSFENVRFYGAARRDLSGGAFWHIINKRYDPYLRSVEIGTDGDVQPLSLPDMSAMIGDTRKTLHRIKEIGGKMFSKAEKKLVGDWLFA